ncbi:MAG TPA: CopG family transcriptional regulator [Kiritimatiellia bacterium]|nr:CopG family transcriptional regulator [Kiritimatiellia bacterium]
MKTTVEIDDALFIRAKRLAAKERQSLRCMIERGLRLQLNPPARSEAVQKPIRWVVAKGGLPRGVDLSSREALTAFGGRTL